ncbi:topoisomerase DNA-binding C4 zinc finger domain-containing protein [Aeromonas enteropelogenes]|uniref:topoisomerase DNA-binding C4 zinc finger domain-containing protein n=1 Tax=Aeromonas enteropelogenes TaxID=29489 RepID=UPI003B9F6FBB
MIQLSIEFSYCIKGTNRQIFASSRNTGIEIFTMAKFLNTSATNYFLEELIKDAKERLILISPFLKLNDRIKELLTDKNRLKIDVRIVYGKSELQPEEISWLKELTYIRTSFCKNLHAKCYLNEEMCIITSLNLYEFSQVNNNEMGVLILRAEDNELYRDAYDEAQRIIRVSEEVRITLERVASDSDEHDTVAASANAGPAPSCPKCGTTMVLRTSKRGDTKGNAFWGCPGYPKCRSLIPIEN